MKLPDYVLGPDSLEYLTTELAQYMRIEHIRLETYRSHPKFNQAVYNIRIEQVEEACMLVKRLKKLHFLSTWERADHLVQQALIVDPMLDKAIIHLPLHSLDKTQPLIEFKPSS